jgi:hypothetical protein
MCHHAGMKWWPWFWIIFVGFFALLAVATVNVAIGIRDSQPRPAMVEE